MEESMRKNLLFFLLTITVLFIWHGLADVVSSQTNANQKTTKEETGKKEAQNIDVQGLIDRINVFIDTNQKQLAVLQKQEMEIQRLNDSVQLLREELGNTRAKLEAVKEEKDTISLELSEVEKQISDYLTKVITDSENIRKASEKLLENINFGKTVATKTIKNEENAQNNKPVEQRNTTPVTVSQPETQIKPTNLHSNEIRPQISFQNERLYTSLAKAATTTGQTVHIQYGEDIVMSKPVFNSKCEADVIVIKDEAVIMQKRYNVCEDHTGE
jgi:chromosome segregation ATPase